ncbi:MAG: SpoIIE family protein phosphatase [Gemmatimonadota bacterium]
MVTAPVPRRDSAAYGIALLRGLLTSLPAAVAYLAGPDLVIEFANDIYCELAGKRDLLGRPLAEAVPEVAEQGRLDLLHRILRTGEPARGSETEVRVRRDGQPERLFVDYVYQPVRDADGAVAGILLYAADVTSHVRDRRRAEAAAAELAATEERYRALFETMPQGVIHYSAGGTVIDVNPAARQMLGLDAAELTRWPLPMAPQAVREDGSPFPRDELPIIAALRTGEIVANVVAGVPHGRTGELRWLRITGVPDARDASGRPQRAYGLMTDITEQRRTEAELRESTALLGRLRDANVLGVMVATEDGIQEANDAFLDMIGYARAEVEGGRMSYETLTPPEWAATDREAVVQLRRTGAVPPLEKEYLHRDGHRVPVLVGAAVVDRHPLRWVTFVIDLSARQRAEQERAALVERERAARAEAGRARERLTFLLNAGALAAATRDRQQLLDQLPRLVVPSLADYCVVFLPAADGRLQAAALAHRDPGRAAVLSRLREIPLPATGPLIASEAYSSGTTRLLRDFRADLPRWSAAQPGLADVLTQMQPQSAIAVPLTAAEQRLGVMVLTRGSGRPRFAATDVQVVEELARRLAAGLANADTAAREHTIAETLQRSLLPTGLPEIPGLDLACRYLPATDGADVGGDWYDAFPVGEGQLGLVVGDVVGHNIASASVMGQLRSMVRAYAIHHPDPRAVLRRTGIAVACLLPGALATVACAMLDVATGEFRLASAGHPPPLLIGGDGRPVFIDDASGIMLGATDDCRLLACRRRLAPGAAVLFYTDGLIEDRGRDIGEGFGALARALAGPASRTAEQICATAEDALLGTGSRADDVCLLAVRREA